MAASDASSFYTSLFVEGAEIVLYRWKSLEADLAAVAQLASEPTRAFAIASAGHEKVLREHQWVNRVEAIVNAASHVRGQARHGL